MTFFFGGLFTGKFDDSHPHPHPPAGAPLASPPAGAPSASPGRVDEI